MSIHPGVTSCPDVGSNACSQPPSHEGELAPRRVARELVFFGRLEVRKGIAFFCDAVDAMVAGGLLAGGVGGVLAVGSDAWCSQRHRMCFNSIKRGLEMSLMAWRALSISPWLAAEGVSVTFLGSDRNWVEPGVDGGEYARRRAADWVGHDETEERRTPLAGAAQVVTGLDTAGALDYLLARGAGRVAVLPSLVGRRNLKVLGFSDVNKNTKNCVKLCITILSCGATHWWRTPRSPSWNCWAPVCHFW